MNNKLEVALKRLNMILPLKERQDKCSAQHKELHQQMLRSFVTYGRILNKDEMANWVDNVPQAMRVLSENDMVTFSENAEPTGAYPFTMSEREHIVYVNGFKVHAMCALDALAVAPMFDETTEINSQCRVTGEPVHIQMSGETIQNPEEVLNLHFGIIWGAADSGASCADSLCMDMIFLKDTEVAKKWLSDDVNGREIFSLTDAVEFSSRFFVPLLI
ncbi:MAG: alkylmercury lyase family protein [Gammaproteobacteria bacterium]|nr:alkylmercury lyase family protein [Gammaproteobacteria bacterium]